MHGVDEPHTWRRKTYHSAVPKVTIDDGHDTTIDGILMWCYLKFRSFFLSFCLTFCVPTEGRAGRSLCPRRAACQAGFIPATWARPRPVPEVLGWPDPLCPSPAGRPQSTHFQSVFQVALDQARSRRINGWRGVRESVVVVFGLSGSMKVAHVWPRPHQDHGVGGDQGAIFPSPLVCELKE